MKFLAQWKPQDDLERSLQQASISFPVRLRSAIEEKPPRTCRNSYPIVHRDFLLHNILFNDKYDIVGVIDWEYAHTSPFEVFAALTNMYSRFDRETTRAAPDVEEDGRTYKEDIMEQEETMPAEWKLSSVFGSVMGNLGLCMSQFEEGKAIFYTEVIDRYKAIREN